MAREGSNDYSIFLNFDAREAVDGRQVDEIGGSRKPLLEGRNQRLPARQVKTVIRTLKERYGFFDADRFVVVKLIYPLTPSSLAQRAPDFF